MAGFRYDARMSKHTPPSPAAGLDPDASVRVLRQFRMIFNAVRGHFRQIERESGIGGAQLWALSEVAANEAMGVTDLSNALDIHQSTASNLVRILSDRQLIAVDKRTDDRRATQLSLTEQGRALLATAPAPFKGVLPAALERMDPDLLGRLERDLATVIEALGADARGAKTPLAEL
jgi:DNA-binding MarR family transcriptional regulator